MYGNESTLNFFTVVNISKMFFTYRVKLKIIDFTLSNVCMYSTSTLIKYKRNFCVQEYLKFCNDAAGVISYKVCKRMDFLYKKMHGKSICMYVHVHLACIFSYIRPLHVHNFSLNHFYVSFPF